MPKFETNEYQMLSPSIPHSCLTCLLFVSLLLLDCFIAVLCFGVFFVNKDACKLYVTLVFFS